MMKRGTIDHKIDMKMDSGTSGGGWPIVVLHAVIGGCRWRRRASDGGLAERKEEE